MQNIQVLTELAIILSAGVVAAFISIKLRLPIILGYLLAGIVLSFVLPDTLHSEFTESLAQLGAAFLLFTIGIEFSLDTIKSVYKIAVTGAIVQAITIIIFSLVIFPTLGFSDYHAFFIGIMASMSSTAFVVRMLEAKEQTQSKAGKVMIAWLVTQDIMIILWFLLLSTLAPNNEFSPDILSAVIKSILVVGLTFGIGKYILPKVMRQIARTRSEELLLVAVVGTIVLFAVIAGQFEVSFTIGAFLAGLALSESFLNHEIFTEIKPLRNIFSMVFFVSIGALFNLSAIGDSIPVLLVILLILLPIKVITIAGINLWFGVHIKNALRIGLGIMQIGEFAFLASQIGLSSGWIDESLYSVIIAATVISLALTPLLYANLEWFYGLSERYARKISPNLYRGLFLSQLEDDLRTTSKPDGHIILCGYGQVGQYVAAALEASQVPFTIIELDAAAVETAAAKKYTAIFGDASNPDILKQAHIATAKAIVISIPSVEDTKKVINEAKQLNPEAKIIVRTRKGLNGTDATGMIDHAIEPEFEVAIQIITQLYKIIHRRNKRVLDLVKALRSEGAA